MSLLWEVLAHELVLLGNVVSTMKEAYCDSELGSFLKFLNIYLQLRRQPFKYLSWRFFLDRSHGWSKTCNHTGGNGSVVSIWTPNIHYLMSSKSVKEDFSYAFYKISMQRCFDVHAVVWNDANVRLRMCVWTCVPRCVCTHVCCWFEMQTYLLIFYHNCICWFQIISCFPLKNNLMWLVFLK